MATIYDLNDTVGASVTFAVASVATDPTAITFEARSPVTGTITSYVYGTDAELVKVSTGNYTVDIALSEPGRWWIRWEGTGTAAGSEQTYFDVDYDRVNQ